MPRPVIEWATSLSELLPQKVPEGRGFQEEDGFLGDWRFLGLKFVLFEELEAGALASKGSFFLPGGSKATIVPHARSLATAVASDKEQGHRFGFSRRYKNAKDNFVLAPRGLSGV